MHVDVRNKRKEYQKTRGQFVFDSRSLKTKEEATTAKLKLADSDTGRYLYFENLSGKSRDNGGILQRGFFVVVQRYHVTLEAEDPLRFANLHFVDPLEPFTKWEKESLKLDRNIIYFNSKGIHRFPISYPCDVSFVFSLKRWEKTGTDIVGLVGLDAVGIVSLNSVLPTKTWVA
ncbi:hypothetical protein SADUNF_Sadunf01G0122500 [Salix dunnii]|uniref:Uncharacterized protein n=1 Tax=Salix dunnii TaxID=1413687 RepID=A0A835TLA5_9ROSI|nr:hypothetical protein SADUNF_Sadunf01G0122500 [Salix dunnii]